VSVIRSRLTFLLLHHFCFYFLLLAFPFFIQAVSPLPSQKAILHQNMADTGSVMAQVTAPEDAAMDIS
jgi:hypothetical protein